MVLSTLYPANTRSERVWIGPFTGEAVPPALGPEPTSVMQETGRFWLARGEAVPAVGEWECSWRPGFQALQLCAALSKVLPLHGRQRNE